MRFFEKGKIISFLSLACLALACFSTLSLVAMQSAQAADSENCLNCHSSSPAAAPNVSLFNVSGHGRVGIDCIDCHDYNLAGNNHNDGGQTYSFYISQYDPLQSGVNYAAGYMLKYVNGEVPLMIPSNTLTFGNYQTKKDNAFRLCFSCHDASKILDDTYNDGISTNFKTSPPEPPCSYSHFSWGCSSESNGHLRHIWEMGPFADSDWDTDTHAGSCIGCDSMVTCTTCHNVHGASGAGGSTNEAMIRDGSLVGRDGYGFSYLIEDLIDPSVDGTPTEFPWVTSEGATQSNSVGAIFRNNTANQTMCFACHGSEPPQPDASYDASGPISYIEYYRSLTISSTSYDTPISENGEPVIISDSVTDTQVTFSQVTGQGDTIIESTLTNPVESINENFSIQGEFLDIHTTATLPDTVEIEICLNYSILLKDKVNENKIELLHYEDGEWVTISSKLDKKTKTICGTVESLSWFVLIERLTMEVDIDIKPGSDPNCFNQNQHGAIPVAILGSDRLDVNDILVDSLSLQGLEVKMAGKSNKYLAHYEDTNEDNYLDLVIQFEDSDGWIDIGSGNATLTGQVLDETPLEGTDSICIVP